MTFEAGYTEDMVIEVWHDQSFSVTFTDAPSLLADLAGYDGVTVRTCVTFHCSDPAYS